MLRRVALVITDVSEERIAVIIRVIRMGELARTRGGTVVKALCYKPEGCGFESR
jgi:hypothetical protein